MGPCLASTRHHGYPAHELITQARGWWRMRLTSTGHHVVHLAVGCTLCGGCTLTSMSVNTKTHTPLTNHPNHWPPHKIHILIKYTLLSLKDVDLQVFCLKFCPLGEAPRTTVLQGYPAWGFSEARGPFPAHTSTLNQA